MVVLERRYYIECAHQLTGMREGHKCARVHGHNYTVVLRVGAANLENGMVLDAEHLDVIVKPVLIRLDHRLLNEVEPTDPSFANMRAQPTAENIACALWQRLATLVRSGRPGGDLHLLTVRVEENEDLAAEFSA